MADEQKSGSQGQQDDVQLPDQDPISDATTDTVKIPNDEESEPANVEGSEAKLPKK